MHENLVSPAFGRCVLSLNSGMAALDDQFAGKVLMVTINGDRPPVSPDDLVKALSIAHGIQISDFFAEVCPPPTDSSSISGQLSTAVVCSNLPGVCSTMARW